jgi:hypothetical protein
VSHVSRMAVIDLGRPLASRHTDTLACCKSLYM